VNKVDRQQIKVSKVVKNKKVKNQNLKKDMAKVILINWIDDVKIISFIN